MTLKRAAPDVPNAVTGNSTPPPPIERDEHKFTVRLSPGALAALQRGEMEERLARYDKSIGYKDITKAVSLKMEGDDYRRLVERALAAGLTINKFISKLLVDPLFAPFGKIQTVPDPNAGGTSPNPVPPATSAPPKLQPALAGGSFPQKGPIGSVTAAIQHTLGGQRKDPHCQVLVTTQEDPKCKIIGFSWEKGQILPYPPNTEDIDDHNDHRVGQLAWQKIGPLPIGTFQNPGGQVVAPDQLVINVEGSPWGWVAFPHALLKYIRDHNFTETHILENIRFTCTVWPNHTFNISHVGTW